MFIYNTFSLKMFKHFASFTKKCIEARKFELKQYSKNTAKIKLFNAFSPLETLKYHAVKKFSFKALFKNFLTNRQNFSKTYILARKKNKNT